MGKPKGGLIVDRKKWYAIATLGAGAGALAFFLGPMAVAHTRLRPMSAEAVLAHAWQSGRRAAFSESLTYTNNLLPAQVQLPKLLNLPIPDASVKSVNVYQKSSMSWRLEELNQNNNIMAVVARNQDRLVTYQAQNNHRIVAQLPGQIGTAWSLWPIPSPHSLAGQWLTTAHITTVAGIPAYALTLRPRASDTLWGTVTYWFQGRDFAPLGFRITDRSGQVVFGVQAVTFTPGNPGRASAPPTVGHVVSWHASPVLAQAADQLSLGSAVSGPPPFFPKTLGPLARGTAREEGGTALAVYGSGPGRVLVLSSQTKAWAKRGRASSFLRPVPGSVQDQGVTDGVWSVVTFPYHGREVTLMGSRSQQQLAKWAASAWR